MVQLILSIFALLAPATVPSSAPADFATRLQSIDQHAGQIHDLVGEFVQEKHSPLLKKPLISRGTVRARAGQTLWETSSPEHTIMSIDPTQLRLYYEKQKTVEEYSMRGQLGMMAASPLPRLDAIRNVFKLSPDDGAGLMPADRGEAKLLAIRLEPTDDAIKPYIDHVRVLLDEARGLALAFEMVDPDGEQTIMRFTNVKIDQNQPDDAFQLKLPADVKIIRPLEGNAPATPAR